MKILTIFLSTAFICVAGAQTLSKLHEEFNKRAAIRLTPEQGQALNFVKALGYPVSKVIEIEIIDGSDKFLLKDKDNNVCFGSPSMQMLRCKNKAGISTVTYEGDGD